MLRPILQDRRFRIALSIAINRNEVNELCLSGQGESSNGVTTPHDAFYIDQIDKLHTQYNPKKANQLLDEVGLMRGDDGMRRLSNGKPFNQVLHLFPTADGDATDIWMLIADYWREVGLEFFIKPEEATLSRMQVGNGNSDFWAYGSPGLHWELEGEGMAPLSQYSDYAPLYGRYYASGGKTGVKPPPEHQKLVDWYLELKSTPDPNRRLSLGRQIVREWAEQCYMVGICRKPVLYLVSNRFRNVPDQIIEDYTLMTPGYIGIEQFWIDDQR